MSAIYAARIATKLGIAASARSWETAAEDIQKYLWDTCFDAQLNSFVSTKGEKTVRACAAQCVLCVLFLRFHTRETLALHT